jgi:DNA-binding NarL/FixJ family response regulator
METGKFLLPGMVMKVEFLSGFPLPEDLVCNPMMGNVRILIADDQEAIRKRVSAIIKARPNLEVCAEATNGSEAVKKAQESNPDLIVLDITMPEVNGLDVARKIKAFAPDTPIVILTVHRSKQLMEEAKIIGVRGYVTKAEAGQNLLTAIDAVLQNQTFFPANI